MKAMSSLARLIFVVSLPLLFVSVGVRSVANSAWFYERGFDNYGVSRTTGLERAELAKAGKALIAYFSSNEESVAIEVQKEERTIPLFNEREVAHLGDVKDLFRLTYRIGEISGLFLIAYALVALSQRRRSTPQELARLVVQGCILTIGFLVILGVGSLIDFEALFVQFHVLSFRNDLWVLDPSKDYLIMMFPEGFWIDATLAVVAITAGQGLVAGGVAYVYLRKRR